MGRGLLVFVLIPRIKGLWSGASEWYNSELFFSGQVLKPTPDWRTTGNPCIAQLLLLIQKYKQLPPADQEPMVK